MCDGRRVGDAFRPIQFGPAVEEGAARDCERGRVDVAGEPAQLSTGERDVYFRRIEAALDLDAPSGASAPTSDQ